MKSRVIFTTFLAVLGLCACESSPSPTPTSKHLLRGFQNAVTMYAEPYTQGSAQSLNEVASQDFYIWIRPYQSMDEYDYSDMVNNKQAEPLYVQFNDVHYNHTDVMGSVMYRQTLSLDIVSDANYDAAHPAGTPLNDIFNVYYQCADNILNPPYNFERTEEQKALKYSASEFKERLTDFNQKKPILIPFNFHFHLLESPAQTSTHRFTVTYKNIDGVELCATTQPVTITP